MSEVYCTPLRFVPTCAAVLVAACLLAGCEFPDPYQDWALRPAGHSGQTQLWEERATGCFYASDGKGKFAPRPMLRPDSSHMGCRQAAQPASPIPGYGEREAGDVNQKASQ